MGSLTRWTGFLIISRPIDVLLFDWLTKNWEKCSLVDSCSISVSELKSPIRNVVIQVLFPSTFLVQQVFSTSDLLTLGLQIVYSSDFENKLAFSSTKSNLSLTLSRLLLSSYFAPPHFVLFSLHHHHHHISIVFPPPSTLNFYCILSISPIINRLQLFFLKHHHHHRHHHISIFSTNTNTTTPPHVSIVFPALLPPGTHFNCFP